MLYVNSFSKGHPEMCCSEINVIFRSRQLRINNKWKKKHLSSSLLPSSWAWILMLRGENVPLGYDTRSQYWSKRAWAYLTGKPFSTRYTCECSSDFPTVPWPRNPILHCNHLLKKWISAWTGHILEFYLSMKPHWHEAVKSICVLFSC